LNVLLLTSSNPNNIAGIVAKDLLKSLERIEGTNVKLVVREYDTYLEKNIISVNSKLDTFLIRIFSKLGRILVNLKLRKANLIISDAKYEIQVYDQSKLFYKSKKIVRKSNFKPDAIIVLFMEKFVNYLNLYELNKNTNAKIYLYLLDMAPFTGGCHYAWNCTGYFKNCGNCPALFSSDPHDQTYFNLQFKKKLIQKTDLEVIIGSEELNKQVSNAGLLTGKKFHPKFYLPINENVYLPIEKIGMRKELNLPVHKKIIFFGASSLQVRRKGFKELLTSLDLLYSMLSEDDLKNVHILIAGRIDDKILNSIPFAKTSLGFLSHSELPKAFQVADIFTSSSIEDSGPMMVNQALMCGTPVVSFEVGVAIDLVKNGITGFIAKKFDCYEYAEGILYLLRLKQKEAQIITKNCRQLALEKFSLKVVSKKWSELLAKN
jgi:glycosyltransferase involved in cell wall biosynthesis